MPSYNAIQNTQSRKPTVDNDLNFSYLYFIQKQFLNVNYNLNNKDNLNIFVVFRALYNPNDINPNLGPRKIYHVGIFGNSVHPSQDVNRCAIIASNHDYTGLVLKIGVGIGPGHMIINSFPSKASPLTLNFSVLSVHYNTLQVNDSLVYCNGKTFSQF